MDPLTADLGFTVTDDDTAAAVGSGSLPVLGTPRLLAWLEAATCAALEPTLGEGRTSVGTRMELQHSAPSPVGARLVVSAATSYVDGRLHRFAVSARHTEEGDAELEASGPVVATGEVTRVVVEIDRFTSRL